MNEINNCYSPRAALAALGLQLQALGLLAPISKRSKKRFAAQQMVMLLGSLAHNILVWSRRWLTSDAPRFAKYGARRIVRDLFHINGLLEFGEAGKLLRITLNQAAPDVREMASALTKLLAGEEVEIKVGAIQLG